MNNSSNAQDLQQSSQCSSLENIILCNDTITSNNITLNELYLLADNSQVSEYKDDSQQLDSISIITNFIDIIEGIQYLDIPYLVKAEKKHDQIPDGEDSKRIHSCVHWHRGVIILLYLICFYKGNLYPMANGRIFYERITEYKRLLREYLKSKVKRFQYNSQVIYFIDKVKLTYKDFKKYCDVTSKNVCGTVKCLCCKLIGKPSDKSGQKSLVESSVIFDEEDLFPSFAIHMILTDDENNNADCDNQYFNYRMMVNKYLLTNVLSSHSSIEINSQESMELNSQDLTLLMNSQSLLTIASPDTTSTVPIITHDISIDDNDYDVVKVNDCNDDIDDLPEHDIEYKVLKRSKYIN